MKKILLVLLVLLVSCTKEPPKDTFKEIEITEQLEVNQKTDLTLNEVIRLAENKGEELTWSDFQMYNAIETGSGFYILVYEIDERFDLVIGGSSPVSSPMYIRLVTKADWDNYIDIRTDDVEKFIADQISP